MVIWFQSTVVNPPYTIYMGADKNENEDLIRWGWPEDVWFHVDKLSSAHVYLRLHSGDTLDSIPQSVIDDCAQLVKANSIQGCKMNDVDVVYTMWDNLKKTGDMAVGQVGFHKHKLVRKCRVEKRISEIVKRLEKTREERNVDLREEREERDRRERLKLKELERDRRKMEREESKRKEEEAEAKSYDRLFSSDKMRPNTEGGYDSDEFM